jgi:hypothetical protein
MNTDQEIIREIGKNLWSIFPNTASKIVFVGMFYSSSYQCGPEWFDITGKRIGPKWEDDIGTVNKKLSDLALTLQRTPPFANTPFTHMRFEMDEQGKTQVDFAYIPEWDSWPGLFMRGVSELSEQEAHDPSISGTWGVDVPHWQECRARREREPYQK